MKALLLLEQLVLDVWKAIEAESIGRQRQQICVMVVAFVLSIGFALGIISSRAGTGLTIATG